MVGKEIEVLIEGVLDEGGEEEWWGRTQWDAPDIDNIVLVTEEEGLPSLEPGQVRKCIVN